LPTNLSVSFWFKSTSFQTHIILGWNQYFFVTAAWKNRAAPGPPGWWYYSIEIYRAVGTTNYARFDWWGINLMDGNWHHVVLSLPNTATQTSVLNAKAWIDTFDTGSPYLSSTSASPQGFSAFSVGDTITGGGFFPLTGHLDDIRVYDGLIRQDQVQRIYNGVRPNGIGTEADITH
jgi:hypothetical protein